MSSSEQDQEDVGATASSSEPDEEPERSSSSAGSDAASARTRSSVEQDEARSNSSRQSNDSTLSEPDNISRNDLIKNLLVKVEKEFKEICLDDIKFKKAVECYLDRIVDFVTLGIVFSVYREIKMGAYTAAVVRMEQLADEKNPKIRTDIFAEYYDKERKCVCSKCTKMILASRFAIHLEVCMGIKKSRTRNTRCVVTATSSREQDSPTYESLPSSDEDDGNDATWSCGGEKRKNKRDRNGRKRVKGAQSKKTEIDATDLMEVEEVDIEGDEIVYEEEEADDDIFSLTEFFVDDSSQSYATASSAGSRSNTSSDEAETKMEQSSPSPTSSS